MVDNHVVEETKENGDIGLQGFDFFSMKIMGGGDKTSNEGSYLFIDVD